MHRYTISKGDHRSQLFWNPIYKPEIIYGQFNIHKNCLYKKTDVEDDEDINKVIGLSANIWPKLWKPPHHYDSMRIGWRPLYNTNLIEIFAYYYKDWNLMFKKIGNVLPNLNIDYKIERIYSSNQWKVFISAPDMEEKVIKVPATITPSDSKPLLGYSLYPYFGGDPVAPRTMNISASMNFE